MRGAWLWIERTTKVTGWDQSELEDQEERITDNTEDIQSKDLDIVQLLLTRTLNKQKINKNKTDIA
jgi:hypothetical protein